MEFIENNKQLSKNKNDEDFLFSFSFILFLFELKKKFRNLNKEFEQQFNNENILAHFIYIISNNFHRLF